MSKEDGKGTLGCLVFLALGLAAVALGWKVIPHYYSYTSLETDLKTEVSRAGAHYYSDETVRDNVVSLARKNDIRLTTENIKVERFAGQIFVTVTYSVPLDLILYETQMSFDLKASSFIGRL